MAGKADAKDKRPRSLNYSAYDVELLLSEVSRWKTVLENKSKDQSTNQAKDQAWKAIAETFSSDPLCPNPRTIKELSLKWQNLKREARKVIGTYNREKRATGGGPPPTDVPGVYRKIEELLPHEFNRIACAFDDDAITSGSDSPAITEPPAAPTPPMYLESVVQSPIPIEPVKADQAASVQSPIETKPDVALVSTPSLPPKKRARTSASTPSSVEVPPELECMQKGLLAYRKECTEAEHNAKMRMLEAEHDLRMQALHWEVKANIAKEQYWREGGPQRVSYAEPTQLALPAVGSFFQQDNAGTY